jgi:hypothetical protein
MGTGGELTAKDLRDDPAAGIQHHESGVDVCRRGGRAHSETNGKRASDRKDGDEMHVSPWSARALWSAEMPTA